MSVRVRFYFRLPRNIADVFTSAGDVFMFVICEMGTWRAKVLHEAERLRKSVSGEGFFLVSFVLCDCHFRIFPGFVFSPCVLVPGNIHSGTGSHNYVEVIAMGGLWGRDFR